ILFDEGERLQRVRYRHRIGRLWIFLLRPFDLRDLRSLWKRLAVARDASPESIDHGLIRRDDLDAIIDLADGHALPGVVSPKLGKSNAVRRLQREAVLRCKRDATKGGKRYQHHDGDRATADRTVRHGASLFAGLPGPARNHGMWR